MAAMLILLALGASDETICADYVQTNVCRKPEIERVLAEHAAVIAADPAEEQHYRGMAGVDPAAAIGLSLVIGIVMAEVLRKLGADKVRVKWPNDLYLQDRKLAGILVELTGKTGDAAQIVIGAGINMAMRRVEESVVNQGWITLQEAGINLDRNTLAAMLIRELRAALELFEQEGLAPYLSRWEKLDNFINRPVKLIIGDKEIFGISRGIDKQGALLLEQDGIIKPWMGGEISLRSAEK